jgi:hypothetical protein
MESARSKRQIPIEEGLFTLPSSSDKGHLIGSKCLSCGQVFFPKRAACPVCYGESMEQDIALSSKGKVYACTVFRHKKAPPGFEGKAIPYSYGYVELSEGVRVHTLFTDCDLKEPLKVGTEVEMVIRKFREDEDGNEIMTFMFKPV